MNAIRFATLAVLAALSSAALADASGRPLTRDEVKAELARAIATNTMPVTEEQRQLQDTRSNSGLTREAVIAELLRAKREGTMPVTEEQRTQYVNRPSAVTRDQVIAELRRAQADGTMPVTEELRSVQAPRVDAPVTVRASNLGGRVVGGLSRGEKNTF